MENFDQLELEKFSKLADQWWDPNGKFKPLHLINPLRTSYIEDKVDIKNLEILDIGCGRANIISSLHKKYKFKNKPVGIDIVGNKDIKKNV